MNQLFFLIPAADEEVASNDIAFIKVLPSIDEEIIRDLFAKFYKIIKFFKEEDIDFLYDSKYLKALMKGISSSESPSMTQLLTLLNDCREVTEMSDTVHTVNGMQVSHSIINNYLETGNTSSHKLVNKQALNNPDVPIQLTIDGHTFLLEVLECDVEDIYKWFIDNRTPQYVFDASYGKHRSTSRQVEGVNVSPLTYSKEQAQELLKRAIIARRGSRILYFKDNLQNKILIFCNENLQNPSFHGFEVASDNQAERQKLMHRGGKLLDERLEQVASFYEEEG